MQTHRLSQSVFEKLRPYAEAQRSVNEMVHSIDHSHPVVDALYPIFEALNNIRDDIGLRSNLQDKTLAEIVQQTSGTEANAKQLGMIGSNSFAGSVIPEYFYEMTNIVGQAADDQFMLTNEERAKLEKLPEMLMQAGHLLLAVQDSLTHGNALSEDTTIKIAGALELWNQIYNKDTQVDTQAAYDFTDKMLAFSDPKAYGERHATPGYDEFLTNRAEYLAASSRYADPAPEAESETPAAPGFYWGRLPREVGLYALGVFSGAAGTYALMQPDNTAVHAPEHPGSSVKDVEEQQPAQQPHQARR